MPPLSSLHQKPSDASWFESEVWVCVCVRASEYLPLNMCQHLLHVSWLRRTYHCVGGVLEMEGRVQDGSRVSWTMDLNLIVTYLGILRRSACECYSGGLLHLPRALQHLQKPLQVSERTLVLSLTSRFCIHPTKSFFPFRSKH